jgi:nitrite reductase/ring-hydroxylating ferredoxin subunit
MAENWIDISAADDGPEDDVIGVEAQGSDVALCNVEGQGYATGNICPHGHARRWEDLRTYPVKAEDGRVFVNPA